MLRLPVGRGAVINSPRSNFLGFFRCHKLGYHSWVIPLCVVVWAHVTAIFKLTISSRIFQQTQFKMYTTTSKQQEGSTYKNSYSKCFITTNFDKFQREAFAKGDESRWNFKSVFPSFSFVFPLQFFHIDRTRVLLKYFNKTHFLICK